ncbi:MAG: CBS domain-containing protein [Candidatus Aramenus sp.]|nr:CBS domain-containing protein [Candidatus Aramenus sp.]
MAVTVSQVSTKRVHVIKADDNILTAAQEMKKHNLGSLLVIDANDTVVGIITERDIVRAFADGKCDAKVSEYMTKDVKGVTDDTPVADALNIMLENGFRHLPIIDKKTGKLSGIVSIRDLVKGVLDPHFLQFGKEWTEVKGTGVVCPVCGIEIDEYGYCGCGTGSG